MEERKLVPANTTRCDGGRRGSCGDAVGARKNPSELRAAFSRRELRAAFSRRELRAASW
jgi:hypothetical protein